MSNGSSVMQAFLFNEPSIDVHTVNLGNSNCHLGIGGGGHGKHGGGGSGEVPHASYFPDRYTDLLVRVRGSGESSSVTTVGGESVLLAESGADHSGDDGGSGYSGGGGYGGGNGGSNGGDGVSGRFGTGGTGRGVDLTNFVSEMFTITPGDGDVVNECGGGGGGVLINGTGPTSMGYGAGGRGCATVLVYPVDYQVLS